MLKTKATSRDKSNYKSTDRFQSHHLCLFLLLQGLPRQRLTSPPAPAASCRSPLSFPVGFVQFPSRCSWVSSWMLQGPQHQLNSVFMLPAANGIYCHLVPYHSNPRESSSEFPALPLVSFLRILFEHFKLQLYLGNGTSNFNMTAYIETPS